jgi:hypothetical protein
VGSGGYAAADEEEADEAAAEAEEDALLRVMSPASPLHRMLPAARRRIMDTAFAPTSYDGKPPLLPRPAEGALPSAGDAAGEGVVGLGGADKGGGALAAAGGDARGTPPTPMSPGIDGTCMGASEIVVTCCKSSINLSKLL